MNEKKRGIGISELLFGLVVLLAIGGTVPLFFLDDALGDQKPLVIIVSSLAFIISFAVLSVYGRAQKRKHYRQYGLKQSLADWMASSAPAAPPPTPQAVTNIAAYLYRANGYRLAKGQAGGALRLIDPNGQAALVQCQTGEQPLGLREVVSFYEMLRAEKAAHGEIWSVSGFTNEAVRWASKKPIGLRDSHAIHLVVEELLEKFPSTGPNSR